MSMPVKEFIELTRSEPWNWRTDYEILILTNGMIELAQPNYNEKLIEIYCNKMNITRDEFDNIFPNNLSYASFICEKYDICIAFRDALLQPKYSLNRFQRITIKKLIKENLITCKSIGVATDYSWYLKHKEKKGMRDNL